MEKYVKLIGVDGEVFFWDAETYFEALHDGIIPMHNPFKWEYASLEEEKKEDERIRK